MSEKAKMAEETSIEEILGSIRRIIAEDDTGAQAAADDEEEPLELTNRIEEDGTVVNTAGDEPRDFVAETYAPPADDEISFADTPRVEREEETSDEISFQDSDKDELSMAPTDFENERDIDNAAEDTILSRSTADATAAVMSRLTRHSAVAEEGHHGITIESIVREMLKPILKDWLDQNLPAIVQKSVDREMERLSRRV